MNKAEMIAQIAPSADTTKSTAQQVFNALETSSKPTSTQASASCCEAWAASPEAKQPNVPGATREPANRSPTPLNAAIA